MPLAESIMHPAVDVHPAHAVGFRLPKLVGFAVLCDGQVDPDHADIQRAAAVVKPAKRSLCRAAP